MLINVCYSSRSARSILSLCAPLSRSLSPRLCCAERCERESSCDVTGPVARRAWTRAAYRRAQTLQISLPLGFLFLFNISSRKCFGMISLFLKADLSITRQGKPTRNTFACQSFCVFGMAIIWLADLYRPQMLHSTSIQTLCCRSFVACVLFTFKGKASLVIINK